MLVGSQPPPAPLSTLWEWPSDLGVSCIQTVPYGSKCFILFLTYRPLCCRYSPEFALRSYAYLSLHGIVAYPLDLIVDTKAGVLGDLPR